MTPAYPRLLPDRDEKNDWYLDEDVLITLYNGNTLHIGKGYRFDSHSVPWWARWLFKRYIKTDIGKPNDVYAALVHDVLISLDGWHRYNRKFEDTEYKRFMNMPEYKINSMRSFWMPLAVRTWGWLKYDVWGDYRGIPKVDTKVRVVIDDMV